MAKILELRPITDQCALTILLLVKIKTALVIYKFNINYLTYAKLV
jgi:hypothetical protein